MISIIVPVYNVEPYLRKCLDSILAQTYRDLEVLVIDDGVLMVAERYVMSTQEKMIV